MPSPTTSLDTQEELTERLSHHEPGIADLLEAYDLAEPAYFAAVRASAPVQPVVTASNTSTRPV